MKVQTVVTNEQIRQVVLGILIKIAPDENLTSIIDDVPFRQQMELDSMDFLDIVMELRKIYRIEIPEEDYAQLVDMVSAVNYLAPLLAPTHI